MVNKAAIDKVIASIRGEVERTKDLGFNMGFAVENGETDRTKRGCGTVACIAGHTYVNKVGRSPSRVADNYNWSELFDTAQEELGLTGEQRAQLFFAENTKYYDNLEAITPGQAIRTLEHLRDTGRVSWYV